MTDLEILKYAIDTLNHLQVPVELLESVTIPVKNVANRLELLYNAVVQNIQKKEEETKQEEIAEPEPEPEN